MAKATVMADGKGNGDGNGWRQHNRDSGGNGQWQLQQQWPAATDGDWQRQWWWQWSWCRQQRWRQQLQWRRPRQGGQWWREGCLFMCQQCAVLWQGQHLASTPMDTKEYAFTSAASWGWFCKEFLLPFKGEGSWQLTMDCFFYFFTSNVQFTEQPSVRPPHYSGNQEPCQPIDPLPPLHLFHILAKLSLCRAWVVCLWHAALWQGWCHYKEVPKSPLPWHKEGCTAQCWAMRGATAKSCLPLFRGRDPDSTRWIGMFYSFQLSLQSTKITLCSPTPIQFPKNLVSLLIIYLGSYCIFCQGKPGQGLQWL